LLQDNSLQGTVPASVLTLPLLHTLNLAANNLTGLFPSLTLAQLQAFNLTVLDMSGNQLYGPLPDLGLLTPMTTLALDQSAGYLFD
jgi:Leucine-rich repeat (LRR) protein